jgi:hypothetical protein
MNNNLFLEGLAFFFPSVESNGGKKNFFLAFDKSTLAPRLRLFGYLKL